MSYRLEKADFLASLPARLQGQAWKALRGTIAKTTTTYTDSPPQGYLRHYRVRAVNGRGWSQASNVVSGRRFYGPQVEEIELTRGRNAATEGMHFTVVLETQARSAPAAEHFSVTANGQDVPIARLIFDTSGKKSINLYTDPLTIRNGDRIEVRYTDPYPFYDDKKQIGSNVVGGGSQVIETADGEDATSFCYTINFGQSNSTRTCERHPATSLAVSADDDENDENDESDESNEELTAEWEGARGTHNGNPFMIGIEFSEAISATAEEVKNAVSVTDATITSAVLAEGSDRIWNLTIRPSGTQGIGITVNPTTDCDAAGAICTSGERSCRRDCRSG